jgi:hypothetical protein
MNWIQKFRFMVISFVGKAHFASSYFDFQLVTVCHRFITLN